MHPVVHYRGEDLPDGSFFEHAVVDKFKIPAEQVADHEFTAECAALGVAR
jgi:hypothetical protein